MEFTSDNIGALSSLLKESQDADESRGKGNQQTLPPKSLGSTVVKTLADNTKSKKDPKAIWTEEEIPDEDALVCKLDAKIVPKYEFRYKQDVGTEDTILGTTEKTPASADCTHLVIKIHFPGATMKLLDLDVTKNRIRAESKTHKLFTYLPVLVQYKRGNAKFDPKKEVLTITLPILIDEDDA